MGKRSNIDKAIRNIMQWAERPEWADAHADVIDAHLGIICERMGISLEELGEELAEYHYEAMLFGVMFEGMACSSFPPDGRNLIDDYLQRRGWRESVPGRTYLRELRESVLSLYEVVEVSPGRHCDLRDLVRGGKRLRVFEHLGTQNLIKWDRIAARVLILNGKNVFSGGILPFSQAAVQSLLRVLDDSRTRLRKELSKLSGKKVVDEMLSSGEFDEALLRDSGPAFTSIWLMHTLERLRAPLPEMVNYGGESLVFAETHFPLLAENLQEIARRLDAETAWHRDDPDEPGWTWILPEGKAEKTAQSSSVKSALPGQHLIYGWLDLKPTVLILRTNSKERAEQGKKVLAALLHGLVGPALSKLQTPEQMLAEQESRQPGDNLREDKRDEIDPEIAAELIHRYQDEHYRNCLDEPIPMLDGKTPRQCANSKKNRGKVIEWLKFLENSELRRAASQGHKPYDSRWMWDELNLSE